MRSISDLPPHWQTWYQLWDEDVPNNNNKERLRGDLFGGQSEQSYSAAFELFLYSLLKSMGLEVNFQPEFNGVNPDLWVSDVRNCSAYLEAGVMYNDPFETEMSYKSKEMPIWEEFKKLQSNDFYVVSAHSSGNPGNVSPRSVRLEVQLWLDQLNVEETRIQLTYTRPPNKTFAFENWELEVELKLKSAEERAHLGIVPAELAGFSGSLSDNPAKRLKSKLKEKFSQARRVKHHCIVAITDRIAGPHGDDVRVALFGGKSGYIFDFGRKINESHPYLNGLNLVQPIRDGLWTDRQTEQPIALMIHRGNLVNPNPGETELWLNPNCSYFSVPLPLLSLKLIGMEQRIWTR